MDIDLAGRTACATLVVALPEMDILVDNAGAFTPMGFFEAPDAE